MDPKQISHFVIYKVLPASVREYQNWQREILTAKLLGARLGKCRQSQASRRRREILMDELVEAGLGKSKRVKARHFFSSNIQKESASSIQAFSDTAFKRSCMLYCIKGSGVLCSSTTHS